MLVKNRNADITLLLDDVNKNILVIEAEIRKAIGDIDVQSVLKPKVKSCMEHLRSCLDYFAKDVYETVIGGNHTHKVYFPYGEENKTFKLRLNQTGLKKLEGKNKEVYDIIESIQPFRNGDNWLVVLCKLTNENKHSQLTPQERLDGMALSGNGKPYIVVDNKSTVIFENCIIEGEPIGLLCFAGGQAYSSKNLSETNLNLVDWTDFVFSDFNISVIDLLKKAHYHISELQQKLYSILQAL